MIEEELEINAFLNDCTILPLSQLIKEKYIGTRRKYSLKLANAIIASTSIVHNLPLITADKQFGLLEELDLIAYRHL